MSRDCVSKMLRVVHGWLRLGTLCEPTRTVTFAITDAQWVDHADFTVLDDLLRINDDVIFEGEQICYMKWRNQGNILSESYSVEISDITEQESIAVNKRHASLAWRD